MCHEVDGGEPCVSQSTGRFGVLTFWSKLRIAANLSVPMVWQFRAFRLRVLCQRPKFALWSGPAIEPGTFWKTAPCSISPAPMGE